MVKEIDIAEESRKQKEMCEKTERLVGQILQDDNLSIAGNGTVVEVSNRWRGQKLWM